ncbi:hypothetical protein M0R45_000361 [Rubus argutus]|uniref:Uncharacterized protein n=1 Tax=Rubus argutus TaxID=59490 RepID=A0AAW1VPH1_RUBAR
MSCSLCQAITKLSIHSNQTTTASIDHARAVPSHAVKTKTQPWPMLSVRCFHPSPAPPTPPCSRRSLQPCPAHASIRRQAQIASSTAQMPSSPCPLHSCCPSYN